MAFAGWHEWVSRVPFATFAGALPLRIVQNVSVSGWRSAARLTTCGIAEVALNLALNLARGCLPSE